MSRRRLSLAELDFSNTGAWPRGYRIGLCALAGALVIALSWWLFVRDQRAQLLTLERQESELRAEYQHKRDRAANLEPRKQQLAQLEQQLQQRLRQLPNKTEIPDLVVDISQTALAAGLASELFQPGNEMPRGFYAEQPIALRLVGNYHQFGAFVSAVASLPRAAIMTLHDIALRPKDPQSTITSALAGSGQVLQLAGTLKTYRYLDEHELDEHEATQQTAAQGQSAPVVPPIAEVR